LSQTSFRERPVLAGGGEVLKDAYFRVFEPWLGSFGVKAGVFYQPFGYEISYSSEIRESPERSRVIQTIFPGLRDLGIALEYVPHKGLPALAQWFNFAGGAFAGNNVSFEKDSYRDWIGRLGSGYRLPGALSLGAGISGYLGTVVSRNDSLYKFENGQPTGRTGQFLDRIDRNYLGFDAQAGYDSIPYWGRFSLRGEYIFGEQPATLRSSASPSSNIFVQDPLYVRDFRGWYLMAVQNLTAFGTQLVAKIDQYDPNTDADEGRVGNPADMKVTILGLGTVLHFNENIRFQTYWDHVVNEEIAAAPFTEDVEDDILTFRLQFMF